MKVLRQIKDSPQMVVAVINRKGGTGKSTVVSNLAPELALRGYRVGVIDTDSQPGNLSVYFGMAREDNLFQAMVGVQQDGYYHPQPLTSLVREVPLDCYLAPFADEQGQILEDQNWERGALYLLPSGNNTFLIPTLLDDVGRFGDLVQEMIEFYELDFVLIDTAPTMSMFDGSIYSAVDGFLYVTECEIGSLAGLNEAFKQVERLQRRRLKAGQRPSMIMGIVPNKVKSQRLHIANLNELAQVFGDLVWPQLRSLKTYANANQHGQTIRSFYPTGPEAFEITQMVNRFEQTAQVWMAEGVK